MIAQVSYYPRGGSAAGPLQVAEVKISYSEYDKKYYAMGLWGCGKMAASPEGAIRMLIQDMAVIESYAIQY